MSGGQSDVDPGVSSGVYPTVSNVLTSNAVKHNADTLAAIDKFIEPFKGVAAGSEPTMAYLELMPNVRNDTNETGTLTGYAAVVRNDLPFDIERTPLINIRTGTGRSIVRLKSIGNDEEALVAAHENNALIDVEGIDSSRINLTEGRGLGRSRQYDLVIVGNDRAAAEELIRTVRTSADPMTLGEIVKLPAYKATLQRSEALRERVARDIATKFNLTVDDTVPTRSIPTHMIVNTAKYTRSASLASQKSQTYAIVFSDAISMDVQPNGAVVFRGPQAGYTWYRAREHMDVASNVTTVSWKNTTASRLFSVFPTDTGLYMPKSGRTPDEHAGMSPELAQVARRRVRSFGVAADANMLVSEAYHSTDDSEWNRIVSLLGVDDTVSQMPMESILAVVPGVQTKGLSLARVAGILARSKIEEVPVSRRALLSAVGAHWEQSILSKTMSVAEVFSREHTDHFIVDAHVVKELAKYDDDNDRAIVQQSS